MADQSLTGLRGLLAARLSAKPRKRKGAKAAPAQGMGIETQDERGHEWAERVGINIIKVVADTKSGTVAPWHRKNLKKWVTDPELIAQYDIIIAFKMDRLSRGKQSDFTEIKHWADVHGKLLVIVDGPVYPARNDSDYWQWVAQERQARQEWEAIQERITRNQHKLRNLGSFSGCPPWGYEVTGEEYHRTITGTEEGRLYVPQVFEKIVTESGYQVARWLTEKTGKRWYPMSVYNMVRCPTYMGYRMSKDGQIVHRCEALVDAGAWHRANAALDARRRSGGHKVRVSEDRAMLSGAASCGYCDAADRPSNPMYRSASSSVWKGQKRTTIYYRCEKHRLGDRGCDALVRADAADTAVDHLVRTALGQTEVTERHLVPGGKDEARLQEIEFLLKELASQGLTEEEEDRVRSDLRAERKKLSEAEPEPDRWVTIGTGITYGDQWACLPLHERGEWLHEHGIQVFLTKEKAVLVETVAPPWEPEGKPGIAPMLPEAAAGSGRVRHEVPLDSSFRRGRKRRGNPDQVSGENPEPEAAGF